jgi:heme/copper-type cytochrome/quinol oxidase subunit 1
VPRLSRWLVRAALVHFLAGVTVGALLLADKGLGHWPALWRAAFGMHVELVLVGWTAQLAMGVAFWMLPRFAGGASRGDERPAWLAFWLVNAGVALVALGPAAGAAAGVTLAGRAAEAAAVTAFALHAWRRVRPPGAGG